uniref:Uncharacterized protein n=1 Tax=Ixodes ricinus TaxID=34613 RepID=A0A6B0UWN0_IXORI
MKEPNKKKDTHGGACALRTQPLHCQNFAKAIASLKDPGIDRILPKASGHIPRRSRPAASRRCNPRSHPLFCARVIAKRQLSVHPAAAGVSVRAPSEATGTARKERRVGAVCSIRSVTQRCGGKWKTEASQEVEEEEEGAGEREKHDACAVDPRHG